MLERIFCLPREICNGPLHIDVRLSMNPAVTFVSAGTGVSRGGKAGSLPNALGKPLVVPP